VCDLQALISKLRNDRWELLITISNVREIPGDHRIA